MSSLFTGFLLAAAIALLGCESNKNKNVTEVSAVRENAAPKKKPVSENVAPKINPVVEAVASEGDAVDENVVSEINPKSELWAGPFWTSFVTFGKKRAGSVANPANCAENTQWVIEGSDLSDIRWDQHPYRGLSKGLLSKTSEDFEIKSCNGKNWVILKGFYDYNDSHYYSIRTVSSRWFNGTSWFDVTNECGASNPGHLYVTNDLWGFQATQVFAELIYNGVKVSDMFWQHQVNPKQYASTNTCWRGEGSKTRDVIEQQELWWDSAKGWALGGGVARCI